MASWFSRHGFLLDGLKVDQVELTGNTIRIHTRSPDFFGGVPLLRHGINASPQPVSASVGGFAGAWARYRTGSVGPLSSVPHRKLPARIFAERFSPTITQAYARRTARLQGLVRHLGLALGGRPAQSLAGRLLFPVSKDTFLRSVRNPAKPGGDDLSVNAGPKLAHLAEVKPTHPIDEQARARGVSM